jgi:acetyl esterase/lipase
MLVIVLAMIVDFLRVLVRVTVARWRRGPLRPGWSFSTELTQAVMRSTMMRSKAHDLRWLREATARAPRTDRVLRHVSFEPVDAGGVPAVWCRAKGRPAPTRTLLYLHGGGYVIGSPEGQGHAELIAHLAIQAEARVLAPDYRLAPEHRFPAPQEDAIAAYRWLLDTGVDPGRLAVGGDSAGGALAVATLLQARHAGDALPAAVLLICPWTDPLAAGGSMEENSFCDFGDRDLLVGWIRAHLDGADAAHPLVSPVNADLAGLPPTLVLWGGAEILRDQIRAFVGRAEAAGVEVTALEWEDMFHDWVLFATPVAEARPAIARLADFLRRRVKD